MTDSDAGFDPSSLRPSLFIDGQWQGAGDGGTRDIVDPSNGSVVAVVDEATPDDALAAVAAARAAFDDGPWRSVTVGERSDLLNRIADLLQRDKAKLAHIETLDTGKTFGESEIDIDDVTSVFRFYADLAVVQADRLIDVDRPEILSRVVHEPIGVCVMIAPWNYPLLQISWKIAPALAAGCTMVLKPSEVTPLSTIAFTELVEEAGVPAGVVNLLQGAAQRSEMRSPGTATSTSSPSPADSPPAGTFLPRPRRTSRRWRWNSGERIHTSSSPTRWPTSSRSPIRSTTC